MKDFIIFLGILEVLLVLISLTTIAVSRIIQFYSKMGWLATIFFIPIFGSILFLVFYIEKRRNLTN